MGSEAEELEPSSPEEALEWYCAQCSYDSEVSIAEGKARSDAGRAYLINGLRERDELRAGIENLAQETKAVMSQIEQVVDDKCDQLAAIFGTLIRERDELRAKLAEYEGMMTREEVLSLLAVCMKDPGSAYDSAQAYALAQVLGAHDQHDLALHDELVAQAEREAGEA